MLDTTTTESAGDSAQPAEPEIVRHRPEFSGRTGEYFGIWFVNLVLSILTLGIYSAWAKVRTERYFYSNTRLAGSSFEYLAEPLTILKGRLIAYAVVIALGLSSQFAPILYVVLILAVFACMPAIIVLSLRFRARNSAWRGLAFRFDRGVGEAYGPFLGWPIISAVTASLLYPLMKLRQHEFVAGGHRFGRRSFRFDSAGSSYYGPYVIAVAMGIGLFFTFFVVMIAAVAGGDAAPAQGGAAGTGLIASLVLLYAGFFVTTVFLRVRYANLLWNNTGVGAHGFESRLRARAMIWIYASNLVAIVCTLGLAVPWAMIRLARYRAEHFTLLAAGSLDDFVADAEGRHGATGAELVDALDVGADFGF